MTYRIFKLLNGGCEKVASVSSVDDALVMGSGLANHMHRDAGHAVTVSAYKGGYQSYNIACFRGGQPDENRREIADAKSQLPRKHREYLQSAAKAKARKEFGKTHHLTLEEMQDKDFYAFFARNDFEAALMRLREIRVQVTAGA